MAVSRRWAAPTHQIRTRPARVQQPAVKGHEGVVGRWKARHLIEWFEHGDGADQIGWGTGGDFARCEALAVDKAHMSPGQAAGFCNLRHHGATGMWPAQHAAAVRRAEGRSAGKRSRST